MTAINHFYEPDFGVVLRDLWAGKIYILAGMLAGLVIAFGGISVAVPHYKAGMLTGPAAQGGGRDIATLLGDYDIPDLQYVIKRSGSSESADFIRFEKIVTGPTVAAVLFANADIRRNVMRDRAFSFLPDADLPDARALAEYLGRHVRIEPVGSTNLRLISYQHPDPEFAADLLSILHRAADGVIREGIRAQTDQRREYLQAALDRVINPDHRKALTALLMEQEQVAMMLSMDEPFSTQIIEPPSASSRSSWPRRTLVYPLMALIGMMMGYLAFTAARQKP